LDTGHWAGTDPPIKSGSGQRQKAAKLKPTGCQIAIHANEPQNAKTKFFNSLENELAEIIIKEKQNRGKKRIARHSTPKTLQ